MTRILIIGAGRGGSSLIEILATDRTVEIVAVVDKRPNAPGVRLANMLRIPTARDYRPFLSRPDIHLVLNVTGSETVARDIADRKHPKVEIIGGTGARFLWQLIDERRKTRERAEHLLGQYQTLYTLGLNLTKSQSLETLYVSILQNARLLTRAPAASLAIFHEQRGEMTLEAARGLGRLPAKRPSWKVRKGSLSSYILNQKDPVVVREVHGSPTCDHPLLLQKKATTLVGVPLATERSLLGILYINHFQAREFAEADISALSLLSGMAAMAIEKGQILESTRRRAITDELTGLYNHRFFIQQLHVEISRAKRYHRRLSLIMLDIDFFKQYNDTNGHLLGNRVLKQLARLLKEACRQVDVVARYGGEEFAIIMPETDRKSGLIFAERLRWQVEAFHFPRQEKQPMGNLTISLGLATYPDDTDKPYELIDRADQSLYLGKRTGRNRVGAV